MQLNKVGPAMAQPNNKEYPPSNGRGSMSWRVTNGRVMSGMSMEDLKHQTALRLANEQREDHCGPPTDEYPIISDRQVTMQGYAPPQQQLQAFGSPAAAVYPQYGSQLSPGRLQVQPPPPPQQYAYTRFDTALPPPPPQPPQQQQPHFDRNYSDSQLGLASPGSQPLFVQPPIIHSTSSGSSNNNTRPNSYCTPRSRNAPLQDRGSAENRSFDGDAAGEAAAMNAASAWSNNVGSPLKGVRVGSSSNLKKKKGNGKQKERSSLDGRVTPVKEVPLEPQRILYSTPNMRREISTSTPTSVYSEPQPSRTNKSSSSHNNRSPRQSAANNNMHSVRSPDFACGRTSALSNPPFYKHAPQQQSKLPHGLTVQELKEMTRARLAAEANYEADSVHSSGTREEGQQQPLQQDRTSPREYPQPPPLPQQNANYCAAFRKSSTDGISISSVPSSVNLNGYVQQPPPHQSHVHPHQQPHRHQRMQQQQPTSMQYPYPRYPSPVYQQQFQNNNSSPVRARSPMFAKPRTDTWDTSSVASEYQVPELYAPNAVPSFSSPMTFNRGRCFSAGATITAGIPAPSVPYETSSWEDARPNPSLGTYYDASLQEANRRRCATMSPPGMSRLHEDRPFLFSGDEKDRLAIPPLSEPRPRFHSTGILGSAFEPISHFRSATGGMHHHGVVPPSPPSLMERVKFNVGDRMLSTGSNGDLPSSVAEAVLESLNASSGPLDLFDSHSPLRSFSNVEDAGARKSPFRKSDNNSEPVYPLDRLVTEESTGSGSMFSSGASKSIFSSEYSNDRLLSMTNSWGGEGGLENSSLFRFSEDFSNLLNIGNDGPGPRGRAATAPCFGENHPFVSQLDPEHHLGDEERKLAPPFSSYESSSSTSGISIPGRNSNLPPGFDKPSESS
eukprot:CCRYP_005045-RA/>CCRYP_005045-RA protein AED:0.10 eAED:0.10 QI:324/1/1/1/0.83/0.71/7/4332/896